MATTEETIVVMKDGLDAPSHGMNLLTTSPLLVISSTATNINTNNNTNINININTNNINNINNNNNNSNNNPSPSLSTPIITATAAADLPSLSIPSLIRPSSSSSSSSTDSNSNNINTTNPLLPNRPHPRIDVFLSHKIRKRNLQKRPLPKVPKPRIIYMINKNVIYRANVSLSGSLTIEKMLPRIRTHFLVHATALDSNSITINNVDMSMTMSTDMSMQSDFTIDHYDINKFDHSFNSIYLCRNKIVQGKDELETLGINDTNTPLVIVSCPNHKQSHTRSQSTNSLSNTIINDPTLPRSISMGQQSPLSTTSMTSISTGMTYRNRSFRRALLDSSQTELASPARLSSIDSPRDADKRSNTPSEIKTPIFQQFPSYKDGKIVEGDENSEESEETSLEFSPIATKLKPTSKITPQLKALSDDEKNTKHKRSVSLLQRMERLGIGLERAYRNSNGNSNSNPNPNHKRTHHTRNATHTTLQSSSSSSFTINITAEEKKVYENLRMCAQTLQLPVAQMPDVTISRLIHAISEAVICLPRREKIDNGVKVIKSKCTESDKIVIDTILTKEHGLTEQELVYAWEQYFLCTPKEAYISSANIHDYVAYF